MARTCEFSSSLMSSFCGFLLRLLHVPSLQALRRLGGHLISSVNRRDLKKILVDTSFMVVDDGSEWEYHQT